MNYAVLFDLNATRADFGSFEDALTRLDGRVSYCKFYSYNQKRNNDFSAYIRAHGAEVAVPLYNRKKVRIDMRQVVDAVYLACTNPAIDAFFIVCAPIDCQPMINMLKSLGKGVYIGGESGSDVARMCDGFIVLRKGMSLDNIPQSGKAHSRAQSASNINVSSDMGANLDKGNGDIANVGKNIRRVRADVGNYNFSDDKEQDNRYKPYGKDGADMNNKADGTASYRADMRVGYDSSQEGTRLSAHSDSGSKESHRDNGEYIDTHNMDRVDKSATRTFFKQSAPYANDAYYDIGMRPTSAIGDVERKSYDNNASISQRSEIASRQDEAMLRSLKSESFLPFTDIEDSGNENMAKVRQKLSDIIAGKMSVKESEISPSQAELDMLLKKYF